MHRQATTKPTRAYARLLCACLAAGACLGGPPAVRADSADVPKEYQVKAAFIYNFANFVTWPQQVFSGPEAPFRICTLGEDPFGQELDNVVAGEKIEGRPVSVQRFEEAEQAQACQIVFLSTSKRRHHAVILEYLDGRPILIVGETDDFISLGGMIQFFNLGSKVRFAISPQLIKDAGLDISANLLRVAEVK